MKIALIGKKNHLYWDYHVKMALEELGHEVFHFQINERPLSINVIRNLAKPFGKKDISDKIYALHLKKGLQEFKPDFAFFTSAFFIPTIYYETIKELHIPILAWDGDGGAKIDSNKKYKEFIDILFDAEPVNVRNNYLGFTHIYYLPFGVNHKIFKPLHLEKRNYIFFIGVGTKRRIDIINKIKFPMKIRGIGWKEEKSSMRDVKNEKLNIFQVAREYSIALAALNIHQNHNIVKGFEGLNMRTFEIIACKTLLLCDYRKEIDNLFEPDKEVVVYNEQNFGNIYEILNDTKRIQKIAEAGYNRVINEHTYMHRMLAVIRHYNQ